MDPRKENDQGVCCYATRQGKRVSLPYIPVAVRYALDKVVFGDVTVVEHANQTGRMQIVAPCRVHAARPFPFLPSGSPIPIYHFPRFPFSIFLFFSFSIDEKNFPHTWESFSSIHVSRYNGSASRFLAKNEVGISFFLPPSLPSPHYRRNEAAYAAFLLVGRAYVGRG